MKQLKFNDTLFTMPYDVVIEGATIRVEVLKEDYTIPQVSNIVSGVSEIKVLENDEVVATYNNYTDVVALQIFSDYPISSDSKGYVISIVLSNPNIQTQIDSLNSAVSSLQETQIQHTENIVALNQEMSELTPYTETKTGYFGETEKTFYNVPEGNVSVFFDNYNGNYSTERIEDRLVVSFDALEHETNITISIQ